MPGRRSSRSEAPPRSPPASPRAGGDPAGAPAPWATVAWALVPGAYLVRSRLPSWLERASWALVHPGAVILAAALLSDGAWWRTAAEAIAALVAWTSLHETGYLENDLVTVRREARPTLRLDAATREALRTRLVPLTLAKGLTAAAAVAALAGSAALPGSGVRSLVPFVAVLIAGRVVFAFHNRVRSRANVATYFALSLAKYVAVPALFVATDRLLAATALMALVFPLPRTIEHAAKTKYRFARLAWLPANVDAARPAYYAVLAAILGAAAWRGDEGIVGAFAILAAYFLVVRLAAWAWVRRRPRRPPAAYRWSEDDEGPPG